jgi:carboxylesterase
VIVPAIVGILIVLAVVGRRYRRALAADIRRRFDHDADGIIRGAEPIVARSSNGAAVLLVHGGGDTPQTMHHLAAAFAERGYGVVAPLLPGHGRDLDAFDAAGADAWYGAVEREFRGLRDSHGWVGVVGLSMGGALSARLAAETQQVDALVLASPYLSMPRAGDVMARAAPLWGVFFPAVRTASEKSVIDPEARAVSLGYGAFTSRSLRALRQTAARGYAALPSIITPTLVLQSTTDNRISSRATALAFERIGTADKRLEWIEGAGHVITVDFGWQRVAREAIAWMDSHRANTKTGRRLGAPSSP